MIIFLREHIGARRKDTGALQPIILHCWVVTQITVIES